MKFLAATLAAIILCGCTEHPRGKPPSPTFDAIRTPPFDKSRLPAAVLETPTALKNTTTRERPPPEKLHPRQRVERDARSGNIYALHLDYLIRCYEHGQDDQDATFGASDLLQFYAEDAKTADKMLIGQWLLVSGWLDDIPEGGRLLVQNTAHTATLECQMRAGQDLTSVRPHGGLISFIAFGRVKRGDASRVLMVDCALVNDDFMVKAQEYFVKVFRNEAGKQYWRRLEQKKAKGKGQNAETD